VPAAMAPFTTAGRNTRCCAPGGNGGRSLAESYRNLNTPGQKPGQKQESGRSPSLEKTGGFSTRRNRCLR